MGHGFDYFVMVFLLSIRCGLIHSVFAKGKLRDVHNAHALASRLQFKLYYHI